MYNIVVSYIVKYTLYYKEHSNEARTSTIYDQY